MFVLRKAGRVVADHKEAGKCAMEMLAGLMEVISVGLIKWFPMFFDILTVFFFATGCTLLWLNIRPRNQDNIIAQKATSDLNAEREFAAKEPPDLQAGYGASYLDAFPSEERINTDGPQTSPAITAVQNSYADRVSSAMAKLRKPSPGF